MLFSIFTIPIFVHMEVKDNEDIKIAAIKAMFETGGISTMRQLETLSPTKLSKKLGINYGRYMNKLSKPTFFTYSEILKLSNILNIKFRTINEVVVSDVELIAKEINKKSQNIVSKKEK